MKSYIKALMLGTASIGMTACTDLNIDLDTRYETLPESEDKSMQEPLQK